MDEAASTNAVLAASPDTTAGPVWCLAHRQTAGRGRRGRAWSAPVGNFTASYLFWPDGDVAGFSLYSFVAALALHDALCDAGVGADRMTLKWPNDVLIDGAKACGILLETLSRPPRTGLILGIGVNLAHAPDPALLEPGALRAVSITGACGISIAPEGFLDLLAATLDARIGQMRRDGFATIRADWLARAAGLGQVLTARLPNATHEGVFEDIDPSGALVLRTGSGRLPLPAADVYFAGEEVEG